MASFMLLKDYFRSRLWK